MDIGEMLLKRIVFFVKRFYLTKPFSNNAHF